MKVVCLRCGRKMEFIESGVFNLETFENGKPYKLWSADLYKCPICGVEVLTGFGQKQIWEHFESEEPPFEVDYTWK